MPLRVLTLMYCYLCHYCTATIAAATTATITENATATTTTNAITATNNATAAAGTATKVVRASFFCYEDVFNSILII